MAITSEDITLDRFLNKFTYTGDPTPEGKVQIALDVFLNTCAILKLAAVIEVLRNR